MTGHWLMRCLWSVRHAAAMSSPRLARGRHSLPNACYEITTMAWQRRLLFVDARTAKAVIDELGRRQDRGDVLTHAWTLMPDHLHWLFELRAPSLSGCLQRFKSLSALAVHRSSHTTGRVWQPGYYDHRLRSEEDLASQASYIVANPIRKGLVSAPGDYPYAWCRWDIG